MGRFNESVRILNQYATLEDRYFAINVFVAVTHDKKTLEEACRQFDRTVEDYIILRDQMVMRMNAPRYYPVAAVAFVAFVALVTR